MRTGRPRVDLEAKQLRGTLEIGREAARGSGPVGMGSLALDEVFDVETAPDYVGMADGYCQGVLDGSIRCCAWTTKAVQRYRAMRAKAEQPGNYYVFSSNEATEVCWFAEHCPHVEGRWASENVVLQPFQAFILVACYGFRIRETGLRLVTVVFFQVARKSAKSTLVAIAALHHLARERQPGAQVICGATTGQQARLVFSIMQRMVRRSLWLRNLGLRVFANAITLEDIGANAKPVNSKASTQDGLNPSFISLDESHAQTFELRDVLVSAMGAREDGTIWCPTTAGYDLTSVGYALRVTATKILEGIVQSDHTFVALYELDDEDDWKDETAWVKAAPMIGLTPKLDYVRRYCRDAQQTPGMQGEFETKICNRWLHSAKRWLSIQTWDGCADKSLSIEQFRGERCWIGVDLAERDDIAVVAYLFQRTGVIYAFVTGYLPQDVIAERSRAVPEYLAWVRSGELVATPGPITDIPTIEADIRKSCELFEVQAVVVERYGAMHLVANLSTDGLPAVVESKNVKVFTAPMKDLEVRLKNKLFRHEGRSFLRWHASNVCVERRRDGSLLSTKEGRESPHKIDGVDAVLLGMSAMLRESTLPARTPFIMVLGPSGAQAGAR